jgi:hypothetical protein
MDPITGMAIGAGLNTLGSLPGLINSFQQDAIRRRLMREGAQDITPTAFRQAQAGLENQANNAQIAGYGQAIDQINQQNATTLGEARRAGLSSSNLLNTLSRLNQQGQAARRNLALQGQQAQEARRNRAYQAQMQRGQFQEQGRQEWNRAIAGLKAAAQQQRNAFYQSPFQGALAGMRYGSSEANPSEAAPESISTMTPMASFNTATLPQRTPRIVPGYGGGYGTYTPPITTELYNQKYPR